MSEPEPTAEAEDDEHPLTQDVLWQRLTLRERQVAAMLAAGATNRAIAESLKVSIKTVDTHRGHVLKKLKLANNTMLAHLAIASGWVPLVYRATDYGHAEMAEVPSVPRTAEDRS